MLQYYKMAEGHGVMGFSGKVKEARKQLNLSQTTFAKELGIARATLIRWENGKFKPNYDALKKFEEYCEKIFHKEKS